MKNFTTIKKIETAYHKSCGGLIELSEFDRDQNKITRAKIRAYMRKHGGTIYLGNINYYGTERHKEHKLTKYTAGMVLNFSHTFMVPYEDEILMRLINDRDNAPYTGSSDDYRRVEEIMTCIESIQGECLIWV